MTDYPFEMLDEAVAAEQVEDETLYAFPQAMSAGSMAVSQGGLTLRDWFAGHCLAGYMAGQGDAQWIDESYPVVSKGMYRMADAMLAAREAK